MSYQEISIKISESELNTPISSNLNKFLNLTMKFIQELLDDIYNPYTINTLIKTILVLKIKYKEEKKQEKEEKPIETEEVKETSEYAEDYFCTISGLLFEFIENHDSITTLDKTIDHLNEIRKKLIQKQNL